MPLKENRQELEMPSDLATKIQVMLDQMKGGSSVVKLFYSFVVEHLIGIVKLSLSLGIKAGVAELAASILKLEQKSDRSATEIDTINVAKAFIASAGDISDLAENVVISILKKHDFTKHSELVNLLMDLSKDPNKVVEEKILFEQLRNSFDALLIELKNYDKTLLSIVNELSQLSHSERAVQ